MDGEAGQLAGVRGRRRARSSCPRAAPPGRKPGAIHATIPKHLAGNKCVQCHAIQCVPEFFNVKLDELKMSAPFHTMETETRARWIEDREAIRAYCRSLDIEFFGQGGFEHEDFEQEDEGE